jgi:hypothetical protein
MEDDKTAAASRKRAAKAKPNDTSNPSATAEQATTGAGKTPRPRKIPPATFVPPAAPSPATPVPAAPNQRAAEPAEPRSPAPDHSRPGTLSTPPTRKIAKKAAKKAAPKAAAVQRTTPAAAAATAPPPENLTEPVAPTPAPVQPPLPPLWPTIKRNPGYATELLALAGVEQLGPQARTHVAWLRDTYPTATTAGLARIAASRSVRLARTQGAVAGLLGPLAVLAETAALLWIQARLVLDIAAAYGRDPADSDRAAELLVLLRVHPDLDSARAALEAARQAVDNRQAAGNGGAADGAGNGTDGGGDGNRSAQVTIPVVRVAGRALVRMATARRAARIVPGAGAVLTAILDGRGTEQLAARATKFYRG